MSGRRWAVVKPVQTDGPKRGKFLDRFWRSVWMP